MSAPSINTPSPLPSNSKQNPTSGSGSGAGADRLWSTPMPKFEKRFRKEILKPINSLLEQTDQEECLLDIRKKIHDLYQGLFWEAKGLLLDVDANLYGNEGGLDVGVEARDKILAAEFVIPGVEANFDIVVDMEVELSLEVDIVKGTEGHVDAVTGIEKETGNLQQNQSQPQKQTQTHRYEMQEGVSQVLRGKLLPQVIRSLLNLGGKDGREFEYVTVRAEDLVVCLLLDFVGFVREVLELGAMALGDDGGGGGESSGNNGDDCDGAAGGNANTNVDLGADSDADAEGDDSSQEGGGKCSRKRNRDQMESKKLRKEKGVNGNDEEGEDPAYVPNMLTYLGGDILEALSRVLAAEACLAGFLQFVRILRSDEWHQPITEREAVQRNLPYYYRGTIDEDGAKSHSALYDDLANDSHDKDEYLTPLRTGEWAEYYCLYYPCDPNGKNPLEFEGDSRLGTFGRHLIAIARYFVQGLGLENLNKLVKAGSGSRLEHYGNQQFVTERIDAFSFKSVMEVFNCISYLTSYKFDALDTSDHLGLPFVYHDLENFRHITCNYLDSIEVGVDISTPDEARIVIQILTMMDDRSLTEEERRTNAAEQHVIGTVADLTREQSDEAKISILWRFLTGRSNYGDAKDFDVSPPSLQIQVLSLTELRSWLIYMENQIGVYESDFQTNIASPALDMLKANALHMQQASGVAASIPTLDLSSMKASQNNSPKMGEDETSSLPPLTDGYADANGADENGSTEVCCYSNASLSSNEEVRERNDDSIYIDDKEPLRPAQGGSSYVESISSATNGWGSGLSHDATSVRGVTLESVILQSKERLYQVLDAIKCQRNNFLGKLLTTNLHRELLKRILPLLQLFTRYGRLNNNDIQLLWNLSGMKEGPSDSQHISVTSAIIDLLVGLLNSDSWFPCSCQAFSFISDLVASVEKETIWNGQKLTLLDAIVRRSVAYMVVGEPDNVTVPPCFGILWRLANGGFYPNVVDEREISSSSFHCLLGIFGGLFWGTPTEQSDTILLGRESIKILRNKLIHITVSLIASTNDLCKTSNIEILKFIISRLPLRVSKSCGVQGQIEYLEDLLEHHDIMQIVTGEMSRYATSAEEVLIARRISSKTCDPDNELLVGTTHSHFDSVKLRVGLLKMYIARTFHVITSSENRSNLVQDPLPQKRQREDQNTKERETKRPHMLLDGNDMQEPSGETSAAHSAYLPTPNQITTMWHFFITKGLSVKTKDCVLEMFHFLLSAQDLAKNSNQFDAWRIELERTLFPLCRDICPTLVSEPTYRLLIYCVGNCNAIEGNYEITTTTPQTMTGVETSNLLLGLSLGDAHKPEYSVCSILKHEKCYVSRVSNHSIEGLDLLWSIVLDCKNVTVSDMAMKYIATLYTFDCNGETRASEQKSLIAGCFNILSNRDPSPDNLQKIVRILSLVRLFTESVYRSSCWGLLKVQSIVSHGRSLLAANKAEVDDVLGNNPSFTINANGTKGEEIVVDCIYGRRSTVGFVRRAISKSLDRQDIRLIYNTVELLDDKVMMGALGVHRDCAIFFVPRKSTAHLNQRTVHLIETAYDTSVQSASNSHQISSNCDVSAGLSSESQKSSSKSTLSYDSLRQEFLVDHGVAEFAAHRRLAVIFSLLDESKWEDKSLAKNSRSLVWNLIQILPTESELDQKLQNAVTNDHLVDWNSLLSVPTEPLHLYHLLYSLQAIERHLLSLDDANVVPGAEDNSDAEVAIIEKQQIDDNALVQEVAKKPTAFVVIDDEDDDAASNSVQNSFQRSNSGASDKKKSYPRLMKESGGTLHLINLLLDLEVGNPLSNESVKEEDVDHLILLLLCSNKIVHLVAFLSRCDGINSQLDGFVTTMLEEEGLLIPLITQILKMLKWTVSFQRMEIERFQSSLAGGSSVADISAALVLQCLRLLRDMVFSSEPTTRHFLTLYCTGHEDVRIPSIISDAISSVVLKTPSRKVRSTGVSVFKEILLLKDEEDENQLRIAKAISINDQCARSNVLGLLVSILREQKNQTDDLVVVVPRFKTFFQLLIKATTVLWNELDIASKATVLAVLRKKLEPFTLSPSICEIEKTWDEELGLGCFTSFFLWVVQNCSIMLDSMDTSIPDHSLAGFLNLMRNMIALIDDVGIKQVVAEVKLSNGSSLLKVLFDHSSFGISGHNKREVSTVIRAEGGNVLRDICEKCKSNYSQVLTFFLRLFNQNSPRNDLTNTWGFDPSLTEKNCTALVGLKNQGATCYMNSLLQQFFHIPAFRHGILYGLRKDDLTSEGCEESVSEIKLMLAEFQELFGNLLLSSKRFYDTAKLVASIKGYDGRSVRPGEQQDVDEFFNLFSDRLETALKGSAQNRILQNVFGGQLSHLITCQQCGFCSERVEDCLSISLDVKGKKNTKESLKSYIQGDLLDGSNQYFCSKCDAKRDSVKRCCIKTLPNVLICHLKRFEFDLETLRKVKVNDRFEYPTELNLKDFTKEGIDGLDHDEVSWRDDDYYTYALRGVLVHSGTADSGHYYSLCSVREGRLGESSNLSDCADNEWFCFNDSTVTQFDPSTLDEASFGGQYVTTSGMQASGSFRSKALDNTKSFSAYLLIYDRKKAFYFDEQARGKPIRIPPPSVETDTSLALSWKDGILERNQRYNSDKILLAPQFRNLVQDICSKEASNENSPSLTAIQVITYHVFDSFVHSSCKSSESDLVFSNLRNLYQESPAACQWFISIASGDHRLWLEKMLLNCVSPDLRSNFAKFLSIIMKNTVSLERKYYYEEESISDDDDDDELMLDCDDDLIAQQTSNMSPPSRLSRFRYWLSKSDLVKFMGSLIDFIDSAAFHWRRFDQLFQVLEEFAHCGQEESLLLIRCGVILKLADFYQSESSAIPLTSILRSPDAKKRVQERGPDSKVMGDRNRKPNFGPLVSLLATLARSAHVPGEDDCDISDSDSESDPDSGAGVPTTVLAWSPYLIYCNGHPEHTFFYNLPARDSRALCNKDLLGKILPAKAYLPSNIRCKDDSRLDWKQSMIDFVCHLCFNNIDASKVVCCAAETIIKDKKSDHAELSVKVLMALVHINDRYWENRIEYVVSSLLKGIRANAEYDKELCLLLDYLIIEVASRSEGDGGFEGEVQFHNLMFKHLEQIATLIELSSSCQIKHRFFSFLKVMLPAEGRTPTTELLLDVNAGLVQMSYSGTGLLCHTQIREEIKKRKTQTGKIVPYYNIEMAKDTIFDFLTGLYHSVSECITSKSTSTAISKALIVNQDIKGAISACAAYSEYFMAMRQCLEGPQGLRRILKDSSWIQSFSEAILPSFWAIDHDDRQSTRCHIDILKGEMILLFERLVQLDAVQFYDVLTCQNQETREREGQSAKMLEVFVTSSDNFAFNNTYTVHYYRLLMALGDQSSLFLDAMLKHDNWTWSLGAFVLNQCPATRGALFETLLNGTQTYIAKNSGFRRKIFKKVTQDSQLFKQNAIDVGALELLSSIFQAEIDLRGDTVNMDQRESEFSCIKFFVSGKVGGMSCLSSGISTSFGKLSEHNSSRISANELSLCLRCMWLALRSLTETQLKQIMIGAWPEVDDLNSILTQITTTTNQSQDDCREEVKEIEDTACKLQKMMLAAQATNSNKQ